MITLLILREPKIAKKSAQKREVKQSKVLSSPCTTKFGSAEGQTNKIVLDKKSKDANKNKKPDGTGTPSSVFASHKRRKSQGATTSTLKESLAAPQQQQTSTPTAQRQEKK